MQLIYVCVFLCVMCVCFFVCVSVCVLVCVCVMCVCGCMSQVNNIVFVQLTLPSNVRHSTGFKPETPLHLQLNALTTELYPVPLS